MTKAKLCHNSAEITTDNGEITFVAARSVQNMNGITYDVKSLQAQNAEGDYIVLSNESTPVAIPLMVDHSSSVHNKVGTIDEAHIESADGVDQVVMHAVFFNTAEAQDIRQRVIDNQLTDVSITTDYGTNMEVWENGSLENGKIVEVSIVYAGAEPKAKILAKNSVDTDGEDEKVDPEVVEPTEPETPVTPETPEAETEALANEDAEEVEDKTTNEDEEPTMATQPTNTAPKVADKTIVLNALAKLAQNGAIRGMNRNQVIEAVKNEISLIDAAGDPYVVPDAVFTEILAVTRPTDILDTFSTVPVKRFTLMGEVKSDADLARAGKWSKGDLKAIQASDLASQVFTTEFLFKLQEISYADLQEDFGDLLLAYIRNELPQKVTEEEERAFIVGDGRLDNNPRHITSVVSLDAAAEDATNVHVYKYDGSADASAMAAVLTGSSYISEEGTVYAVMSKATLAAFRAAGLDSASGLPFSVETVAGALGVERIFTREYVAANTVYLYTGQYVKRLTGASAGESIEQYDIDYNNRKIEFIRPVGGGASGLASAVKVVLPGEVSA